jgi:hypothetical protein
MPTLIAFGPLNPKQPGVPDEPVRILNFDQIREVIATSGDECTIWFSETDKRVLHGSAAREFLDIVTRMLSPNVLTDETRRQRTERQQAKM